MNRPNNVDMENRMLAMKYTLATAILGASLCAAPAFAARVNAPGQPPASLALFPKAASDVDLIYSPITGTFASKGVAAISNPETGVFCITPTKIINYNVVIPVVTVEWGQSLGNSLLAFYELGAFDCSKGDIEVRTYDFNAGGAPVSSELVAFTIYVP